MAKIARNLGRFKQWTEEKLGASPKKSLVGEEFARLEAETDALRVGVEKLHAATVEYLSHTGKKKESVDNAKTKVLPVESLGTVMATHGERLGPTSIYGQMLMRFGHAHEKIALAQQDYVARTRDTFLSHLSKAREEMKEFQQQRKKLEQRRQEYESKASRVKRMRKERPELEEEMHAAKEKFEETLNDVQTRMVRINDAEEFYVRDLSMFFELEFEFYRTCAEVLAEISGSFYEGVQRAKIPKPVDTRGRNTTAQIEDMSTLGDLEGSVIDPSGIRAFPGPPPTEAALRGRVQRKAKYRFETESRDELSLRPGDIITVLDDSDEGWWIGEIVDEMTGVRRIGMFPANYTVPLETPGSKTAISGSEVVVPDRQGLPRAQSRLSSSSSLGVWQDDYRAVTPAQSEASGYHGRMRASSVATSTSASHPFNYARSEAATPRALATQSNHSVMKATPSRDDIRAQKPLPRPASAGYEPVASPSSSASFYAYSGAQQPLPQRHSMQANGHGSHNSSQHSFERHLPYDPRADSRASSRNSKGSVHPDLPSHQYPRSSSLQPAQKPQPPVRNGAHHQRDRQHQRVASSGNATSASSEQQAYYHHPQKHPLAMSAVAGYSRSATDLHAHGGVRREPKSSSVTSLGDYSYR